MSGEINTVIRSVKDIKYNTIYETIINIDFQFKFFNKLFSLKIVMIES